MNETSSRQTTPVWGTREPVACHKNLTRLEERNDRTKTTIMPSTEERKYEHYAYLYFQVEGGNGHKTLRVTLKNNVSQNDQQFDSILAELADA